MRAINNIQNLSVAELLEKLYNSDDSVFISHTDLVTYVEQNSNKFQSDILKIIYSDIIRFVLTKMKLYWFGKKVYLDDICFIKPKHIRGIIMKQDAERAYNDLKRYLKRYDIGGYFRKIALGNTMFHEFIYFPNRIGAKNIVELLHIVDDKLEKEKLTKEIELNKDITAIKSKNSEMKNTNFMDLFKTEHQNKIDRFKSWLKREEYINDANEITASNYTNFARLFYLLRDNSIIKPNINNTKGITAYFKEFGVNVVETLNSLSETPEIARKTVTNENAKDFTQLGMTQKETTNLLNLFKNN